MFDWGNRLLAVAAAFGSLGGVHPVNEKLRAQSGPSCLPMTAVLLLVCALLSAGMLPWDCQIGLSFLLSCTQTFACLSAAALCQNGSADNMAPSPLPEQARQKQYWLTKSSVPTALYVEPRVPIWSTDLADMAAVGGSWGQQFLVCHSAGPL
jgi:hypothetical protein